MKELSVLSFLLIEKMDPYVDPGCGLVPSEASSRARSALREKSLTTKEKLNYYTKRHLGRKENDTKRRDDSLCDSAK